MIDYTPLFQQMLDTPLESWSDSLRIQLHEKLFESGHGDFDKWLGILNDLPVITPSVVELAAAVVRVGLKSDSSDEDVLALEQLLLQLRPWRKGPFSLFGIDIDTEWRSDLKWQRLENHIEPLKDRLVLDVGCGSGYHCWRMSGEGARLVIGIDTTLRYIIQFHAVQKYVKNPGVHVLPLNIDEMPENLNAFDTVFSMGVLYHRRSPVDHLYQLKSLLADGGQLVLETLVIDEQEGELLVPDDRYGKMRNVWFIPSCSMIQTWLKRCGFINIQLVDVNQTSGQEQRRTRWMEFESLSDFLDPQNQDKTIEGHPAPRRAIFIANKV